MSLSRGAVQKLRNFFAGSALVVHGIVTNTGRHGLTYVNSTADVHVPRAKRPYPGLPQAA